MITDKIKNLFQFIEFLHSNIENFNQYKDLINELVLLVDEIDGLKFEDNYIAKLKLDDLREHSVPMYEKLQNNTASLISAKAIELRLGSFDDDLLLFNNKIDDDIKHFKVKFSRDDLPEIFTHKLHYLEFRKNDYCDFLTLFAFFEQLDRTTKYLFDYFKLPDIPSEFEDFETKVPLISDLEEGMNLIDQHQKLLPFPLLQKQESGSLKENFNYLKKGINLFYQMDKLIDKDPSLKQQINNTESFLPPRLESNLITDQRDQLFTELVNGGFIPNENPDCFNWAIGATDETEPIKPGQWQPIKWKKSKMAFVEIMMPFYNKITSRPTNKFIGLLFLDENDKPMKDLKKPGKDETSGDYGVICNIIDQLKPKKTAHINLS